MKNSTQEDQSLAIRLSGYAAAAGALIALAPSANAQVIWSGIKDQPVYIDNNFQLDLNNDGKTDFNFVVNGFSASSNRYNSFYSFKYSWSRTAYAYVINSGTSLQNNSWAESWYRPQGFYPGNLIDNNHSLWYNNASSIYYGRLARGRASYLNSRKSSGFSTYFTNSYYHSGNFAGQEKFLGVRFYIGDQQHYGWVRANLQDNMYELNIVDWGYQNLPDSGIIAGGIEPAFINDPIYNLDTVQVGLNFPIQVQNLVAGDFVVSNGVVTDLTEVMTGEQYLVSIKAFADGEVGITIPIDSVDNSEGLYILAQSTKFMVDTKAPHATINAGITTTSIKTITDTVVFDEKIKGLTLDDFIVSNGTKSNLQIITDSLKYTLDVTAIADGEVDIQLPAAAVADIAGNGNIIATESYTYIAPDLTPPIATIDAGLTTTNDSTITVAITFDEKIKGLTLSDFTITNGDKSNFKIVTDSLEFTIDVTAAAEGDVGIQLPVNSVTDKAGNGNILASETYTYIAPVSIENITTDNIVMYPNPAIGTLYIKLNSEATVTFINAAGEVVLVKEHFLDDEINISGLKSGIYVVQIQQEGNVFHEKLIVE